MPTGVVLVHEEGQLQLGAHPVGAGDQNGVGDPRQVQFKQPAEAADVRQGAGVMVLAMWVFMSSTALYPAVMSTPAAA